MWKELKREKAEFLHQLYGWSSSASMWLNLSHVRWFILLITLISDQTSEASEEAFHCVHILRVLKFWKVPHYAVIKEVFKAKNLISFLC